jgi:hypothetical protein
MKQPFLTVYSKSLKKYAAIVTFFFCLPLAVFSQEQQQDEQQQFEESPVDVNPVGTSTGTLSTSPWPNSSGSSTQDNQSTQGSNGANSSNTSARPGSNPALRPVGGGTVTTGGPGGGFGIPNPDVPFDDNMNLAFLVVGLVFVFVVFKKRFGLGNKIQVSTDKK